MHGALRQIKLASTSEARLQTLENRPHYVYDVVALVEGVLYASNAAGPELVLAEEFGKLPQSWNGRPVVLDHPIVGGERASANEPRVLDHYRIGYVFHAKVKDKKLVMEAWIDPERVQKVEPKLLERLDKKDPIEVSVGVFTATEERGGVYQGKSYEGIWRDIVPDHLAFLPEGTTGACSVEMGCGAPRAAAAAEGGSEVKKTWRERFAEFAAKFRPSQEGQSDNDLRANLDAALRAVEPGYLGVDAVFPEDGLVVYATAPEDSILYFRRGYTAQEDGAVELAKDKEEVKPVTRFEPVNAAAKSGSAACGCGEVKTNSQPTGKEVQPMIDRKRVDAIIASGKTCFQKGQEAVLEAMPEEAIKIMEANIASATPEPKPEVKPEVKPEPEPKAAAAPSLEEQDQAFYDRNPAVREIVAQHRAAQAEKRTALVAKLKAASGNKFTEEELQAMPLEQLDKIAGMLVEKPDFSGRVPRDASSATTEGIATSAEINARFAEGFAKQRQAAN